MVLGIIALLICTVITPSVAVDTVKKPSMPISNGKTLYVGGTGEGNYTTIQSAIDNASDGDTVFVYDDSSPFYEQLVINKTISLIGEDKNTTIIDGQLKKNIIVNISSDDFLISGFTIRNCRGSGNYIDNSVIQVHYSDNVTIKDNYLAIGDIAFNGWTSVIKLYASNHCTIKNNIMIEPVDSYQGRTIGFVLVDGSSHNYVSGNDISKYAFGFSIENYKTSYSNEYNIIIGNHIHHNYLGVLIEEKQNSHNNILANKIEFNEVAGIKCISSQNTTIYGNIITNNGEGDEWDSGIKLDSSYNDIRYNIISNNNPIGVLIWSSLNQIINNQISNNYQIGVYSFFARGCKISKNNFIDNGKYNAFFEDILVYSFRNKWRNNYWSDKTHGTIIHRIRGFIYPVILPIPWLNFDWLPARKPHDICTIQGCDKV